MTYIIAQFAHIKPRDRLFGKYLNSAFKAQNADIVVLGEYVLNEFFKEYDKAKDRAKLKRDFSAHIEYLTALAKRHNTTFVAPIIAAQDDKLYKTIAVISAQKSAFYHAQRLMTMEHWDEGTFFDNPAKATKPLVWKVGDLKISAIFGWEAHFDEIWMKLRAQNVEVVIVPCANTFHSNARWARLLQTRSFVNNCFVIRVNRVGHYMENSLKWAFYGHSFVALPQGDMGDMLGDKEGILSGEIKQSLLESARKDWGFR